MASRSRIPARPWPGSPAATGDRPSSLTCSTRHSSSQRTSTSTADGATACLSTFVSDSWTTRYAVVSIAASSRRGRPPTVSRTGRPAARAPATRSSSPSSPRAGARSATPSWRIGPEHADAGGASPRGPGDRSSPPAPSPSRAAGGSVSGGRRGRLREGDHDGQAVRDDVVQLAGEAGPLGTGRQPRLLVPLAFGPGGAVDQRAEVGAAGLHRRPDEEGRGHQPGQEDDGPEDVAGRGEADRGEDGAHLEHRSGGHRDPARLAGGHRVQRDQQGDVGGEPEPDRPLHQGDGGEDAEDRHGRAPPPDQRQHQRDVDSHTPRECSSARSNGREREQLHAGGDEHVDDARMPRRPPPPRGGGGRRGAPDRREHGSGRAGSLRRRAGGAGTRPRAGRRRPRRTAPRSPSTCSACRGRSAPSTRAAPALLGRYGSTCGCQRVGSSWPRPGATSSSPNRVAMPPAVLRTMKPIPTANSAITVRYSDTPMTARSACGALERGPVRPEHLLAEQEGHEGRYEHEHEGRGGEHHGLAGEHRQPARHRHQAGPDHAGGVLAGHDQHAEDADGQLGEVDAGEAAVDGLEPQPLLGPHLRPVVVGHEGDQHPEPDHRHDGGGEGDPARPQRDQLDPLGLRGPRRA